MQGTKDFNKSSKYAFILNEYLEVFNRGCYNIVNEFNIITYLQNIVKRGVGMEVQRPRYLNQLIDKKDNGRVKIITGIRRCGKSYLLFELYRKYLLSSGVSEEQIIMIALDSLKNIKYRNPIELDNYLRDKIQDNEIKHYIFIDEIQFVEEISNPTKLVHTFMSEKNIKISQFTVSNYLDYFIDAFFIEKVRRYDVKGRKYISSPYKYYFSDIGLRNARLNFRQNEQSHIMENVIYIEKEGISP